MSETERRKRYYKERVLIDTGRVLDPQFDNAVIHVTGAQLELLRNLMAYLHRESTFVSEYHDIHYLTPTAGEWDSLLAVVANLEEKLMGNENVIWGYYSLYAERELADDVSAGHVTQTFSVVPEGEVWTVTQLSAHALEDDATRVYLSAIIEGIDYRLKIQAPIVIRQSILLSGPIILHEGDYLQVFWTDAAVNNNFRAYAIGYKMQAI